MSEQIWVLAGQSNMEGCAPLEEVEPSSPVVSSFGMNERWEMAEEPLHILEHSMDPIHNPVTSEERMAAIGLGRSVKQTGAGLGLAFGKRLNECTGDPIGLIPCAHGGTSLDQWDPGLVDLGGGSLYGSMVRRISAAGKPVTGLLWYQGESDALNGGGPTYAERWHRWIQALRRDLDAPVLPVYWVQLSRVILPESDPGWNQVQLAQLELASKIPHTGMVAAVDLPLCDEIHVDTSGLRRLGRRLANLVLHDVTSGVLGASGPTPAQAEIDSERLTIKLLVNSGASLRTQNEAKGFTLTDSKDRALPITISARVGDNEICVDLSSKAPERAKLWYGHGTDPDCNIIDQNDMALPVFSLEI